MFRRFMLGKPLPKTEEDHDIEKGWDIEVVIAPSFLFDDDKHRSRSGVRTHECINTVELKSTPLDQLGHPAMMSAMLISYDTDE